MIYSLNYILLPKQGGCMEYYDPTQKVDSGLTFYGIYLTPSLIL